jgi:hypothetical protein
MLFDLQGRRKTGIKVIYMGLALLMGGGLVLFGIGSQVNGGFADFLTGGTGGGGQYKKQVEQSAKRVAVHPNDPNAYETLIADRFSYAGVGYNQKTQKFDKSGNQQLELMIGDWKHYVKLTKKPDLSTAGSVVNAYIGKNSQDVVGATEVQTIVARLQPNAANYLYLMRIALASGNTRIADASAIKATELATKDQKKQVAREIKQLRALAATQSKNIQKQIQQQFAAQQKQGGGANPSQVNSPFGGLGGGAGTGQ